MSKTVQAFKITASFTPGAKAAKRMMQPLRPMSFSSGRLSIKHAIAANYGDPDHTVRVNERIAEIRETLRGMGEVHSFNITAGSVPAGEAEELAAAERTDELPEGYRVRDEDGALIIPDSDASKPRGHTALVASFDRVETDSGKVIKSRDGEQHAADDEPAQAGA